MRNPDIAIKYGVPKLWICRRNEWITWPATLGQPGSTAGHGRRWWSRIWSRGHYIVSAWWWMIAECLA